MGNKLKVKLKHGKVKLKVKGDAPLEIHAAALRRLLAERLPADEVHEPRLLSPGPGEPKRS